MRFHVISRIKKCTDYAHKEFDCKQGINEMREILYDCECDDDSNITDKRVLANITNTMGDLQVQFQQIKF